MTSIAAPGVTCKSGEWFGLGVQLAPSSSLRRRRLINREGPPGLPRRAARRSAAADSTGDVEDLRAAARLAVVA